MHRCAVDVGGTFIDFVLLDEESGALVVEKQPARRETLVDEFLAGLERLPVSPSELDLLFHGTTVGINAVLQERGARVGLVTTAGFRDVLELGRGSRPELYNVLYRPPAPLVPRYLRREVPERLAGGWLGARAARLGGARRARSTTSSAGRRGGRDLLPARVRESASTSGRQRNAPGERHPDLGVTASHEVATEWREFERTSTTVLNAYIQPLMGRYSASSGSDSRSRLRAAVRAHAVERRRHLRGAGG